MSNQQYEDNNGVALVPTMRQVFLSEKYLPKMENDRLGLQPMMPYAHLVFFFINNSTQRNVCAART